MSATVVIVGAGHAAGQAALSLRQKGHIGRIIMLGDESCVPYQRPALSKKFLAGEIDVSRLYFRPEKFYAEHAIELRSGTRVAALNPVSHSLTLESGEQIGYDKLLLTTGSRVRRLPVPGHDLPGVHYLRSIADVEAIRPEIRPGARLVIVGGGYIGLEVAAVTVRLGLHVTVLETEGRVMNRVVAPEVSQFFQELHRSEGVQIELGRRVEEIEGTEHVSGVRCSGGHAVPADLCIIGIGIVPNIELAEAAGIRCSNGIVVDEYCQTSAPNILAAGDCTRHPNTVLGRHLRLESVHNAIEQGKTAAATICGERIAYSQVPWFWSDQYDVKLQIVGLSDGYDQFVMRGDPATRSFAAFYLQQGKLLAVDAINSPREFMLGKKLIAAGAWPDRKALADTAMDFRQLTDAALAAAEAATKA